MIMGGSLIILSIDVLRLKEWARKGMVYYYPITCLVSLLFVIKSVQTSMQDPEIAGLRIYVIAVVTALVLLNSVIVIFFFTRPKVKQQFDGATAGSPESIEGRNPEQSDGAV